MKKNKQTYREIHGTTRVGDFLRKIGKSDLLEKIVNSGLDVLTGDYLGAIKNLVKDSDELTSEQRTQALEYLQSDVSENEEISNRWKYDMQSDSWLSKNVRPMMLIYLTFTMSLLIYLDSSITDFIVELEWITLLKSLLLTTFIAYFGGRSFEKTKKL